MTLALALALTLGLGLVPLSAHAQTSDQLASEATAVAARISAQQPAVLAALRAYQHTLGALARGVSLSVEAQQWAAQAATALGTARSRVDAEAQAIYMAGGMPALYATVLSARSPGDALARVGYVQSVLRSQTPDLTGLEQTVAAREAQAADLAAGASTTVTTVDQVQTRYAALLALLAQEQSLLASLSAQAATLRAAEVAAAEVAAVAQAAAAAGRGAGPVSPMPIPAAYDLLFHAAATTCPGLSWTVLAAIGQVESGDGANLAPSSAGALGPMQFMPATFAAYAVDADGDKVPSIMSPADSIYTAARYLCANAAGGGPAGLRAAVYRYNHADWYVTLVLGLADRIAALQGGAGTGGPAGAGR
ncbi:MAG: lytic murein transglycosylase [Actinomycetes bacterium]